MGRDEFVALVKRRGAELYRELPWRGIDDPYAVLVSEVMLQQTQVARVEGYWGRWMEEFPDLGALASAETPRVLELWQGLGYNRRALALKRAAEECASQLGSTLPATAEELEKLPGIGPATAAGIVSFAYQRPSIYLETNVRSVFLHELFPGQSGVPDSEIIPYVADACPNDNPRSWYYALLDYGAHLKSIVPNPSRRSQHHARQSKFEGSRREKRSFILKAALANPSGIPTADVENALDDFEQAYGREPLDHALFESLVNELVDEGFFKLDGTLILP